MTSSGEQGQDPEPGSAEAGPAGRASLRERLRTPLLCGVVFALLQVAWYVVRFGHLPDANPLPFPDSAISIGLDLVLFLVTGSILGLYVDWLVRGSTGWWQKFLIAMATVAMPLAVWMAVTGGLLGPPGVLLYALAPFLLLLGVPALLRRACRRLLTRDGDGNCC